MLALDMTPWNIRAAVDRKYAAQIDLATPTPYPPADMIWGSPGSAGAKPRQQHARRHHKTGGTEEERHRRLQVLLGRAARARLGRMGHCTLAASEGGK